jgi:NAD(P)-dependent dehydrogenase (short-subunit alcohol dehydrogenase family)
MDAHEKILVLGGTGHFGARICRRLADISGSELIVTSRDQFRAEVLADELSESRPDASISALALNQESADFEAELRAIAPFAVVHTAGPYQGQDYRVARACIDAGSHYIDLADGREFVAGFGTLHHMALDAGVLLVSGASTLPGLSSTVIKELRSEFRQINSIEMSIALAQRTPRGVGTVSAVLSYCGRPFQALSNGEWRTMYGWQDLRRQYYPDLGRRLSAACDVPDLELLPEFVPGVRTVSFHAALEADVEQLTLWLMAWLTRMRLVTDWSRYAHGFASLSKRLGWMGSNRGGMEISVTGDGRSGEPLAVDWSLTAEVPCTPAVVLVKKLLRSEIPDRGAMPCLDLFSLDEFMNELSGYSIATRFETR